MDWQKRLDTYIAAKRAEAMKTSPQLTLGELIIKLEAIEDKSKPVIFNEVYYPTGIESWRGSYAELALTYETGEGTLSTADFIAMLRGAIGETFYGYKGGEFVMSNDTQAVVGVSEDERHVIIETKNIEY